MTLLHTRNLHSKYIFQVVSDDVLAFETIDSFADVVKYLNKCCAPLSETATTSVLSCLFSRPKSLALRQGKPEIIQPVALATTNALWLEFPFFLWCYFLRVGPSLEGEMLSLQVASPEKRALSGNSFKSLKALFFFYF